jgi:phage repressor protein C with HTH and peptisase S24 domain
MLTHEQIWTAIDRLAARAGLSPSGLAKRAGLDPTTFNKSKRKTGDGRARWPSTESVAKALAATGIGLDTFVRFVSDASQAAPTVPLLGFAEAAADGHFDDGGSPIGNGWAEAALPAIGGDARLYALEISGDSMRPAYRDGDIIIVSPTAPIRRGDRVVLKTRGGEMMAKELHRRTPKTVELQSLDPARQDHILAASDVVWIARIVWSSQ